MIPPIVINIKTVNGTRPPFDVYIGRQLNYPKASFPRSKWANPYSVKAHGERALVLYEKYARKLLMNDLHELAGKVIGCWCKPAPCHGDILIKLFKEKFNEYQT